MRNSAFSVLRQAVTGQRDWQPVFRTVPPSSNYDFIVVGSDVHALAVAETLAASDETLSVAVFFERPISECLNTFPVDFLVPRAANPGVATLIGSAIQIWPRLSKRLGANVLADLSGQLSLFTTLQQIEDGIAEANLLAGAGIRSRSLSLSKLKRHHAYLNLGAANRYPVCAGRSTRAGGVVTADALATAYWRAAFLRGVDVVDQITVTSLRRAGGRLIGLATNRGAIDTPAVCFTGDRILSAALEDARLNPLLRQTRWGAFSTRRVGPTFPQSLDFAHTGLRLGQVPTGEIGALMPMGSGGNAVLSFAEVKKLAGAAVSSAPVIGRLAVTATWCGQWIEGADGSPIVSGTNVDGVFVAGGWGVAHQIVTPIVGDLVRRLAAGEILGEGTDLSIDRASLTAAVPSELAV